MSNPCKACESCLMPFSKDSGKREHERYCSLCYQNGKLSYEGDDLREFQKQCYDAMRHSGMNVFKASFFTFMIRFAKRWQRGR